jgi:hypothetical protein
MNIALTTTSDIPSLSQVETLLSHSRQVPLLLQNCILPPLADLICHYVYDYDLLQRLKLHYQTIEVPTWWLLQWCRWYWKQPLCLEDFVSLSEKHFTYTRTQFWKTPQNSETWWLIWRYFSSRLPTLVIHPVLIIEVVNNEFKVGDKMFSTFSELLHKCHEVNGDPFQFFN